MDHNLDYCQVNFSTYFSVIQKEKLFQHPVFVQECLGPVAVSGWEKKELKYNSDNRSQNSDKLAPRLYIFIGVCVCV